MIERKLAGIAVALGLAGAPQAQPTADQALTEMGFTQAEKQRVLNGEFVTSEIGSVSKRDLSFAVAFLVKISPDELSKEAVTGSLFGDDPQVQAYGGLSAPGGSGDFSGLRITPEEARALTNAEPIDGTNRSAGERESFKALAGSPTPAVQERLQQMLLARYQAYRASGLAGIAPYDHGRGNVVDVAVDLAEASRSAAPVKQHMPPLYAFLLDDPKAAVPGLQQTFLWVKSIVRGKPTYVLVHLLTAADGEVRAAVRREFYVSTGYNAEQTIAGFLPVAGGTIVLCMSHTFTDQVAGSGSSLKRGIGSRVLADQMKAIFDKGRKRVER